MPAATAIGAALLAFGPPAVFFFGFIAPRSQLLIMSVLAAFVWVVAITIAGIVWVAIPPLQDATALHLPVAVLVQVSVFRASLRATADALPALAAWVPCIYPGRAPKTG